MKNSVLVVLVSLAILGASAQEEKKISVKDVPAPVMNKFKAFYSEVTKVKWEMTGTNYEAEFKGTDKKKMAIIYSPEGNVLEKEWEVKKADMPKPVQDSLAKQFPGAHVEELTKLDKAGLILFEIEMDTKINKEDCDVKIEYTPDGKVWSKEIRKESDEKNEKKKEDKKDVKKEEPKK